MTELHHIKNTLIGTGDEELFLFRATVQEVIELSKKFPNVKIIIRANTTASSVTELYPTYHLEDQISVYIISNSSDSMLIKLAYNS